MFFPIWNQSVVPCPLLTVASWTAYRFLKRQGRWSGIPISFRIFQFIVIHTVKGFGILQSPRSFICLPDWTSVSQFAGAAANLILVLKMFQFWASLVVHRWRVHLAMHGTLVQSLLWEDPTCHRATEPMRFYLNPNLFHYQKKKKICSTILVIDEVLLM